MKVEKAAEAEQGIGHTLFAAVVAAVDKPSDDGGGGDDGEMFHSLTAVS